MQVRPATREDIEAFSDIPERPTAKAWAGFVDGKVVALGGFAFSKGRWFAFCDLKPEARPYKMTIARWGIRIMNEARNMGIKYVYADADLKESNSVKWLKRLGFEIDPRTDLYRWRA